VLQHEVQSLEDLKGTKSIRRRAELHLQESIRTLKHMKYNITAVEDCRESLNM